MAGQADHVDANRLPLPGQVEQCVVLLRKPARWPVARAARARRMYVPFARVNACVWVCVDVVVLVCV
jgi:hypothetical protein